MRKLRKKEYLKRVMAKKRDSKKLEEVFLRNSFYQMTEKSYKKRKYILSYCLYEAFHFLMRICLVGIAILLVCILPDVLVVFFGAKGSANAINIGGIVYLIVAYCLLKMFFILARDSYENKSKQLMFLVNNGRQTFFDELSQHEQQILIHFVRSKIYSMKRTKLRKLTFANYATLNSDVDYLKKIIRQLGLRESIELPGLKDFWF